LLGLLLAQIGGRDVAERLIRAFFVVADEPLMDVFAHFGERAREVGVERFVAEAAVEPVDVAVLHGTPGLDVMEVDVMIFTPGDELGRDEFRTAVDADLFG
jgi:hypothetical protein